MAISLTDGWDDGWDDDEPEYPAPLPPASLPAVAAFASSMPVPIVKAPLATAAAAAPVGDDGLEGIVTESSDGGSGFSSPGWPGSPTGSPPTSEGLGGTPIATAAQPYGAVNSSSGSAFLPSLPVSAVLPHSGIRVAQLQQQLPASPAPSASSVSSFGITFEPPPSELQTRGGRLVVRGRVGARVAHLMLAVGVQTRHVFATLSTNVMDR